MSVSVCMLSFCVYLEPVGAKAPTFSSASTSFTFKHRIGDNFGLLCQAQAFPVPLIRYFSAEQLIQIYIFNTSTN